MIKVCVRLRLALTCVGLLLLIPGSTARAAETGVFVDVRESEAPDARVVARWKLYGSSHALVIGINDYGGGWPRLTKAVEDARKVGEALAAQGFDVTLRTNLTSDQLRRELTNFYAIKGAAPDARLVVWFAGHGYSRNGEGYLVPTDAGPPSQPAFLAKALPMRDFGSLVRLANAKHAMAIFDSCFAGTIFTVPRSRPPVAITQATQKPVRQFLTSGDADQEVADDGTFRSLFIDALNGEERADANGDGYLTGAELGFYLEDRLTNLTQGHQTPRSGKLRDRLFDQGDFVFVLPHKQAAAVTGQAAAPQPAAAPATPSQADLDLAFWNAVKDSDNPAQFQAYLEAYPNGRFAALARVKANAGASPQPQQAALPKTGQTGFEGTWRGTLVPGNCPVAEDVGSSYQLEMDIAGGKVTGRITGAQSMRLSGEIDDDGTLKDVSANFPEGVIRLKGKLGNDKGSGDWRAVGLRCRGSFRVSRH